MTREQIHQREQSGAAMPNGFTGLWRGKYYYKGREWVGNSNLIGYRKLRSRHDQYRIPEYEEKQSS